MAMTKKEKAEFDAAIHKANLLAALRWTEKVEPDLPPPDSFKSLTKGFLFSSNSLRVEPACSSSVSHCFGRDDKTTTQNSRHIYSTQLLAFQAMRHEVELEAAAKLLKIDEAIAKLKQAQ